MAVIAKAGSTPPQGPRRVDRVQAFAERGSHLLGKLVETARKMPVAEFHHVDVHQSPVIGHAENDVADRPGQPLQFRRVEDIAQPGHKLGAFLGHARLEALDQAEVDHFLRFVVVVNVADGIARGAGDVAHRGAVVALVNEGLQGGGFDLLLGAFGVTSAGGRHNVNQPNDHSVLTERSLALYPLFQNICQGRFRSF